MSAKRDLKNKYILCWLLIIGGFAINATQTIPTIDSVLFLTGLIAFLVVRFNAWYAEEN